MSPSCAIYIGYGRDASLASLRLVPPVRTEYGRNLRVGRDVFIDHDRTIMDLGGVDIGSPRTVVAGVPAVVIREL